MPKECERVIGYPNYHRSSEGGAFITRSPMNSIFQIWALVALFLAFVLVFLNLDSVSLFGKLAEEDLPNFIYEINVKDIKGNDVSLSAYEGKVLLIVNVASKCGLTHSNYKEMNVLYEKYREKGFEILAFPCNQFAGQEPGSNEEIKETVCSRFKAEFPIFEKINVNGKNTTPLYKYLKSQKAGFLGSGIKWNFTKFLVGKNGAVVRRYSPNTLPSKIESDIQKQLKASW